MNNSPGFILTKLLLSGDNLIDASVCFRKGLNLIVGPSDTGKTLIFEYIRYMLGGKLPKIVPESEGYTRIFLELFSSGKYYTLKSDLNGGNYELYECQIDEINEEKISQHLFRSETTAPTNKSIGDFLLELIGMGKKQVIHRKGLKRSLRYSDISRIILTDEARVLTDGSPFLSPNHLEATVELNTIKFLLSGVDDTDTIITLSTAQINNKQGRLVLLKELIEKTTKEMLDKQTEIDITMEGVSFEIEQTSQNFETLQTTLNSSNVKKLDFSSKIEERKVQIGELEEIIYRSDILHKQYNTDISRLKSNIEASEIFIRNENPTTCPLCQSDIIHACNDGYLERLIIASQNEILKIEKLLVEGNEARKLFEHQRFELKSECDTYITEIKKIEKVIESSIEENKRVLSKFSKLYEKKSDLNEIKVLARKLDGFIEQKCLIEDEIKNAKAPMERLDVKRFLPICELMAHRLQKCTYPDSKIIYYSEIKNDFNIGTKGRGVYGKGYRAISLSIFLVSFLEYLVNEDREIGPLVIDSPLVTYKGVDESKDITQEDIPPEHMIGKFYSTLIEDSTYPQIIIIENQDCPSNLDKKINKIKFSRNKKVGRYGFFH